MYVFNNVFNLERLAMNQGPSLTYIKVYVR